MIDPLTSSANDLTAPMSNAPDIDTVYSELFDARFFVFDDHEPYFQERLLQVIWNEQLLIGDLTAATGERLQIVHPGIWNVESGPDFHDATVILGGRARRGAVEVHFRPEDWDLHGHTGNADYSAVVLHVVWRNPAGHGAYPGQVPVFVLSDHLQQPIQHIIERVDLTCYPYAQQVRADAFAAHIATLDDELLSDMLQSYGLARLLSKARRMSVLITRDGLEAAAYQVFFDVLGYKRNREAFAELATRVPLPQLAAAGGERALALLLGSADLLPDPVGQRVLPQHTELVRRLWDLWWGARPGHAPLPWHRHRMRPLNAPERRVIAAHLVLQRHGYRLAAAIAEAAAAGDAATGLRRLRAIFDCDDEHWRPFLDFGRELKHSAALLGQRRIDDLVVNLALPLLFSSALRHGDAALCRRARDLLLHARKLQDNRLLKEAVSHFFLPPSRARQVVRNACAQQGLLQLYQCFHLRPGDGQRGEADAHSTS